jgi:hypothetical protein
MTAKPKILREFENLPADAQKEVPGLLSHMNKFFSKWKAPVRSSKTIAKAQAASIKKWAGKITGDGFTGRDHDKILYGVGWPS